MKKEKFSEIEKFNQKTIQTYFNILEGTPQPAPLCYNDLDYWSYLENLYNSVNKLGNNQLLALTCIPYYYNDQVCFLWSFIFQSSCLNTNAICNWLEDDENTPQFTNQGNITIVTLNAL